MEALLLLFKFFAWTHPIWTALILLVGCVAPVWIYTRWIERVSRERSPEDQPNILWWLISIVLTAIAFTSAILQIFLFNDFLPTVQECRTVHGTRVVTKSTVVVFDEDPMVDLDSNSERVYNTKVKVTLCRKRLEFEGDVFGEWEMLNPLIVNEHGNTRSLPQPSKDS